MKLSDVMLADDSIKAWNSKGELLPDPNLVRNIEYIESFIDLEIEEWSGHARIIDAQVASEVYPQCVGVLFRDENVIRYLKTLFGVSTYYVACAEAMDRLTTQLYKISTKHYDLHVKKPKLNVDKVYHEKVKLIRNLSFIHQDSKETSNPMDKRSAMSWLPTLSSKAGVKPTSRDYVFGGGKWWVTINGIKTETEIDITVPDLSEYINNAKAQLFIRRNSLIGYYLDIKDSQEK